MSSQATSKRGSVVKEIRALLDSTPKGLTVREIEKDYSSICCKRLREVAKDLGYLDTASLLTGLARDGAIRVSSNFGEPVYTSANPDGATKHITELVSKQRKKTNRRGGLSSGNYGKRNGLSLGISGQPSPRVAQSVKANIIELIREHGGLVDMSNINTLYFMRFGSHLSCASTGFRTLEEAIGAIGELEQEQTNQSVIIKMKNSKVFSSEDEQKLRLALETNVRKVLESNRDGVVLTKFSQEYRRVIGTQLNPTAYGQPSLLALLNSLIDIVSLTRSDEYGEWLITLYSKAQAPMKKELTLELKKTILSVFKSHPEGIYIANFDSVFELQCGFALAPASYGYTDMNSLLADVIDNTNLEIVVERFGKMVRPKSQNLTSPSPAVTGIPVLVPLLDMHDAVGPGVRYSAIPEPPLMHYIEVIVSHIDNPGKFYVQIMSTTNTGKALEELMDMLEVDYTQLESHGTYMLPPNLAVPGQLVVCRYPNDNNWHRARITGFAEGGFVFVCFVDYGTVCSVHKTALYFLKSKFLRLPAQAVAASLYGIQPVSGTTWPAIATKTFATLVSGSQRLCSQVIEVSVSNSLSMLLTNTTGSVDLHINDFLVSSDLAIFSESCIDLPQQDLEQADRMLDWSVSSDEDDPSKQPVMSADCTPVGVGCKTTSVKPIESRPSQTISQSRQYPTPEYQSVLKDLEQCAQKLVAVQLDKGMVKSVQPAPETPSTAVLGAKARGPPLSTPISAAHSNTPLIQSVPPRPQKRIADDQPPPLIPMGDLPPPLIPLDPYANQRSFFEHLNAQQVPGAFPFTGSIQPSFHLSGLPTICPPVNQWGSQLNYLPPSMSRQDLSQLGSPNYAGPQMYMAADGYYPPVHHYQQNLMYRPYTNISSQYGLTSGYRHNARILQSTNGVAMPNPHSLSSRHEREPATTRAQVSRANTATSASSQPEPTQLTPMQVSNTKTAQANTTFTSFKQAPAPSPHTTTGITSTVQAPADIAATGTGESKDVPPALVAVVPTGALLPMPDVSEEHYVEGQFTNSSDMISVLSSKLKGLEFKLKRLTRERGDVPRSSTDEIAGVERDIVDTRICIIKAGHSEHKSSTSLSPDLNSSHSSPSIGRGRGQWLQKALSTRSS